jgi:hypothetical protein
VDCDCTHLNRLVKARQSLRSERKEKSGPEAASWQGRVPVADYLDDLEPVSLLLDPPPEPVEPEVVPDVPDAPDEAPALSSSFFCFLADFFFDLSSSLAPDVPELADGELAPEVPAAPVVPDELPLVPPADEPEDLSLLPDVPGEAPMLPEPEDPDEEPVLPESEDPDEEPMLPEPEDPEEPDDLLLSPDAAAPDEPPLPPEEPLVLDDGVVLEEEPACACTVGLLAPTSAPALAPAACARAIEDADATNTNDSDRIVVFKVMSNSLG